MLGLEHQEVISGKKSNHLINTGARKLIMKQINIQNNFNENKCLISINVLKISVTSRLPTLEIKNHFQSSSLCEL